MSVIAWDSHTLATDRMAHSGGFKYPATKIHKTEWDDVLAVSGDLSHGLVLMKWFESGKNPADWPAFQTDDDFTWLVVADSVGCRYFATQPLARTVETPFHAWGSGSDFAMGAMAMGANAREAVEIASRFSLTVGLGVDAFDVIPREVPLRAKCRIHTDHDLTSYHSKLSGVTQFCSLCYAEKLASDGLTPIQLTHYQPEKKEE